MNDDTAALVLLLVCIALMVAWMIEPRITRHP